MPVMGCFRKVALLQHVGSSYEVEEARQLYNDKPWAEPLHVYYPTNLPTVAFCTEDYTKTYKNIKLYIAI